MSWRSGQAYSQDLRDRVLAAVDEGMPVYRAAPLFRVSVSYIYKALIRRRTTGETRAWLRRGRPGRKLAAQEGALRAKVREEPDTTLEELRAWLLQEFGVSISIGALWATLDRLGLRLKKRQAMRPSRSDRTSPPPARPGASASRA
jgi:transposase